MALWHGSFWKFCIPEKKKNGSDRGKWSSTSGYLGVPKIWSKPTWCQGSRSCTCFHLHPAGRRASKRWKTCCYICWAKSHDNPMKRMPWWWNIPMLSHSITIVGLIIIEPLTSETGASFKREKKTLFAVDICILVMFPLNHLFCWSKTISSLPMRLGTYRCWSHIQRSGPNPLRSGDSSRMHHRHCFPGRWVSCCILRWPCNIVSDKCLIAFLNNVNKYRIIPV